MRHGMRVEIFSHVVRHGEIRGSRRRGRVIGETVSAGQIRHAAVGIAFKPVYGCILIGRASRHAVINIGVYFKRNFVQYRMGIGADG